MDYKEQLFTASSHDSGAECQLIGQDGKKVEMWLTVLGVDSKKWRRESAKMSLISASYAGKTKKEIDSLDPEKMSAEALAECIKGWRGFKDGEVEVKFSKKRVTELFIQAPYIKDHVDKFFSNRLNFTKGKAGE